MSASNRAKLIGKLHTALKKSFPEPTAQPNRPLLEHLLYACLLEDAPADLADESLAKCEQDFFDWNEVRVTTVTELSQVFSRLPDPMKAATRLKSNLQAVFEHFYTFDLDHLKKENLGKAVGKFEKMPAMSPFVLSYTVQHGLGGHSIPIDYSAMVILLATGIVSQAEAMDSRVPGIERAIPKSKGIEFSALLHSAAVMLNADIGNKKVRTLLDAVDKGSSARLDEWIASKKAAQRRAAKQKVEQKKATEAAEAAAIAAAKLAAEAPAKVEAKKTTPKKEVLSAAEQAKQTAEKTEAAIKRKVAKDKKESKQDSPATQKPESKAAKKNTPEPTKALTKKTSKKAAPTAKTAKPNVKPASKTATKTKSLNKSAAPVKKKSTKKPAAKPVANKSPSSKKSTSRKLSKRKPR